MGLFEVFWKSDNDDVELVCIVIIGIVFDLFVVNMVVGNVVMLLID